MAQHHTPNPAPYILKVLMWRNTKAGVADEYVLPPRLLKVCVLSVMIRGEGHPLGTTFMMKGRARGTAFILKSLQLDGLSTRFTVL